MGGNAHDAVRAFAEKMRESLPDHDTLREVPQSRVVLLAGDEDTWVPKLKGGSDFWARD